MNTTSDLETPLIIPRLPRRWLIWLMPMIVALVTAVAGGYLAFTQTFGKHPVLIASSPASTNILLDGNPVGVTPLTLRLRRGAYTLTATKAGYEPMELAIPVSATNANIVNIRMSPPRTPPPILPLDPSPTSHDLPDVRDLAADVLWLKSVIILHPEDAATIPILTEKLNSQAAILDTFQGTLRDLRTQGYWYLLSTVTIAISSLGVLVTMFNANRKT